MISIDGQIHNIDDVFQFTLLKKLLVSLANKKSKDTSEFEGLISKTVRENKKRIDDIESKILILELNKSVSFQESTSNDKDGTIQSGLSKIQNTLILHLDKINNRLKKIEEENLYAKQNLNVHSNGLTKLEERLNFLSKENSLLKSDINIIKNQLKEDFKNIEEKNKKLKEEIKTDIKTEINEIIKNEYLMNKDNIKENNKEIDDKNKNEENKIFEDILKNYINKNDFNELNMKINSLSASLSSLKNIIDNLKTEFSIEETKNKVYQLTEAIETKASIIDYKKIKDTVSRNKEDIDELQNFRIEQSDNVFRLQKNMDKNNKNIEKINSSILLLQTMIKDKDKFRDMFVLKNNNNNLPLNEINDSIKKLNDGLISMQKEMEDYWRELDSIKPIIHSACMSKDLKNLQDIFISNIDELQVKFFKKFSDKLETQKSFRLLEAQIKHLIDEFEQKLYGNPDGYILTKEASSGFRCASCEATINGYKSRYENYLPYNKHIDDEGNNLNSIGISQKPYFLGSCYSRALANIDFNLKDNKDNNDINTIKDNKEIKNYDKTKDSIKEYNNSNIADTSFRIKSLRKKILNQQAKCTRINHQNKKIILNNIINVHNNKEVTNNEITNKKRSIEYNNNMKVNSFNEINGSSVNNNSDYGQIIQTNLKTLNQSLSHNNLINYKKNQNKGIEKYSSNTLMQSKNTNQTYNSEYNNKNILSESDKPEQTKIQSIMNNNNSLSLEDDKLNKQKLEEIGVVKITKKTK